MAPAGLPEVIGGKYRPRDVLGAGSTGTVYSVEHTFTGELLALKLMRSHLGASPDAIARFKREARAVSKIRSQHVVRIFDADVAPELGGVPYLVMDLLEGVDLEHLSAGRRIEPATVVEWLWQIALPLDKAHSVGIVHRDLKPENLFLTRTDDGRPLIKILDFGIAKITADSPSTTQSGLIFGTPLYMAPEQARADPAQVGPAVDLYALGLIAYQLLTGFPYRTETSLTAVLSEIHNPLRAPSELGHSFGPQFDRWFLRACQPDPAQRFASAQEQIEELARALDVPLEAEAAATSSSVGLRDSLTPESRQSPRDSGWDVIMRLRDAPAEKGTTSLEGRSRMLSSTVAAAPKGRARAARRRWRPALLALALLALPVAFVLARGRSPHATTGGLAPTACAAAPPIAVTPSTVSVAALQPVPTLTESSPAKVEAASDTPAFSVPPPYAPSPSKWTAQLPPAPGPHDALHLLPTRVVPAHTAPPRAKSPADDEALSDQQ